MISLCKELPDTDKMSAELLKIKCLFEAYKDDGNVLFWCQDEKSVISLTDGNMIIYCDGGDTEEIREFVEVINPAAIYSDIKTLKSIGRVPKEEINVMARRCDLEYETNGDRLSSREIYDLLNVDGLSLPLYPDFAVDYCRRLNMGFAKYFAIKDKCAVITFSCGENAIINGIASHEKGYGEKALLAALNMNFGKTLFVCCRDKVKGFYEKYNFLPLYKGGYWVKNDGNN